MGTPAPWGSIDNPTISHIMKRLQVFYGRPLLFIDFEFNSSQEPMLNLVCGDMILSDQEETIDGYWLKDDPTQKRILKNLLLSLRKKNPIIVSYMAVAEARSFLALGIDPHQFDCIDLYAEWRQLTFNNESCEYGTIFSKNGFRLHSVPPSYRKEFNKGRCNTKVGMGMVDCVGQMFGVFIDSLHKNEIRDLIISNPPEFTPTEKKAILDYCASDVLPLPHMMLEMLQRLQQATKMVKDDIIRAQLKRGRYMASVAKMESVGLPINAGKARNLRNNFESAREAIISDLVENHYPFYVRKKIGPKSKGFVGDWVETYSAFVSFLTEKHPKLLRVWPKTVNKDTGKTSDRYSLEDKVMGEYDGIPEIYAYRQAKKNIRQMSWFKEPDEKKKKKSGDFFDSVGSDGRVRTFLGSYGTQTCVAGDALVLSKQRGYLRITEVAKSDLIWDGEEFVKQEGLHYSGLKNTMSLRGITLTPDHRVLNKYGAWEEAQDITTFKIPRMAKDSSHSELKNKEYENPTGKTLTRVSKRCGIFHDTGYIATNVHFSNLVSTQAKDRLNKFSLGCFLGNLKNTPTTYAEARIKWKSIIRRVLNKANHFSYLDSTIHTDWKNFSNFSTWYEANKNPANLNPVVDKDFIVAGNKEYGPNRCLVVTERLNSFIVGSLFKKKESVLPVGVSLVDGVKGLYACSISVGGVKEIIGYFDTTEEACITYQLSKQKMFKKILEEEKNFLTLETYNILKTYDVEKGCSQLNTEKRIPVYDITNCGPRSRFVVYNNDLVGTIVHNSRNAPKASRFILAQSAWLRCLIEPPEGKAVAAPDYGSQEFGIAAIKSKDPNMIEAYRSGDPYLFFAKCAGAVPWEADGKKCKEPAFVLSEKPWVDFPHGVGFDEELKLQEENLELFSEYQKHCKYKEQRDLAKSLVLGLQFGMGVVKLALKLSADMGRFVSEQEAGKLLAIHKKTFKVFWAWVDKVITTYKRKKVLILQDGWALLGDNDNDLSVKNFPVQGTGAVIMREAVKLSHQMSDKDLDIISPLHDALYCLVDEDKAEEQAKVLVDNMKEAVRNVLGDSLEIRIDMDIHRRGDIWIEPKGKRFYALLSKYLEPMEKVEDQEKKFIGTICSFCVQN